jgi:hypothetical protein
MKELKKLGRIIVEKVNAILQDYPGKAAIPVPVPVKK